MNHKNICSLSEQMIKTCEMLCSLSKGCEDAPEEMDLYEDMIFDDIAHVQALALELTKIIAGDSRGDDGAFAEGELESVINKKDNG